MRKVMLVKEVNVKTLVSGDKGCRITLESLYSEDIGDLSRLASETEIAVIFDIEENKLENWPKPELYFLKTILTIWLSI